MFNQKNFFSIFLFLLILFSLSNVFADGMFHKAYPNYWELSPEENQLAFINYENGYENMVLSIGFDPADTNQAVWIFPIPAKSEETVINVVDSLPNFSGKTTIQSKAGTAFFTSFALMSVSQLYSVVIFFPVFFMLTGNYGTMGEVIVKDTVEKYGVTTQLVSATDGASLYEYLATKGAVLPNDSKNILNNYVGKNYSFVVVWISDASLLAEAEAKSNSLDRKDIAVFIKFPTNKIFFPLLPTSVYGSQKIPATIYVSSLVSPELYKEIKSDTQTSYYYQGYVRKTSESDSLLFNQKIPSNFAYTKIEIDSFSKYYIADLWFNNSVPFNIAFSDFFNKNLLICTLIIFILISCISSLIAGLFAFGRDSLNIKNILLLGFSNILTILAFIFCAYKFREKITSSKNETPLPKRNVFYWILMIPLTITVLLMIFLIIPLYYGNAQILVANLAFHFALVYIPFFIITAPITWGYFYDRKMLKFILSFSVIFIVLQVILYILSTQILL